MKKEATNQLAQREVRFAGAPRLLLAAGWAALLTLTPLSKLCAQIGGTTAGSTTSAYVGDDVITVSSINIGYFTSCSWIANGLTTNAAWGNNYVFAGQGVASGVANISPSDFTVSGYGPWIGTSTATANYLTMPSGDKLIADILNGPGINNKEAGGIGINISYTPGNGDPTSINFVQAYVENINGTGFTTGVIDVPPTAGSPFFNAQTPGAGTGTTRSTASPMMTSATVPGWLADQPYDNEYGNSMPGADETTTNTAVYFQSFVEAQKNIGGTNYNVLYGGIQWGYTFNTLDAIPEPGSLALVTGFTAAGLFYRHLRKRARNGGSRRN